MLDYSSRPPHLDHHEVPNQEGLAQALGKEYNECLAVVQRPAEERRALEVLSPDGPASEETQESEEDHQW